VVGFKATGTYRRALTYYLITAGFELWLISSIAWHGRARPCIMGGMRTSPKEVQVILHNAADRRHSAFTSTRLSLGSAICKNCLR